MIRAISLVALLVAPTLELQAQHRASSEDSDSTKSSIVDALAAAGKIGFSFLGLAHQRNGDGTGQRFCYLDCADPRPSAALEMTVGPLPFRPPTSENYEPGTRSAVDRGVEPPGIVRASERAKGSNPVANGLNNWSNEHSPSFLEIIGSPNNEHVKDWGGGPEVACALHACVPDLPLVKNPVIETDEENPDLELVSISYVNPELTVEELPVLVNPEPGTWLLVATGIGGLALVRKRIRR